MSDRQTTKPHLPPWHTTNNNNNKKQRSVLSL
jgi:hypothetical protein